MNDRRQEIKEQERPEASLLRIQDIKIAQVNQLDDDDLNLPDELKKMV